MELKLPVDLSNVKDQKLKNFLQQIELKAYLELTVTESEFILTDSYIVHENKEMQILPLNIKKKDLL